jgi:hypothetical protein
VFFPARAFRLFLPGNHERLLLPISVKIGDTLKKICSVNDIRTDTETREVEQCCIVSRRIPYNIVGRV